MTIYHRIYSEHCNQSENGIRNSTLAYFDLGMMNAESGDAPQQAGYNFFVSNKLKVY